MNWQGDVRTQFFSFPLSGNPVVLSRGCTRALSVTPQTELGMAINTKKVIVAGLAAGVVMNILDYLIHMVFGAQMTTDLNAFQPGLGDSMNTMSGSVMTGFIIMDLVIGMLLAYTYAAIRPRFGPGAKTAIIVGLMYWIFGSIMSSTYLIMGMMSRNLWLTYGVVYLVCLIIASLVAGALYKEDAATV